MPIYEYRCEKCGDFEATQRITEPALKRCPKCKGKVERLLSRTSFVLKGSGWYATDYAQSSTPKSDSATTESSTKESSANGTTSTSSETSDSTAKAAAPEPSTKKGKSSAAKSTPTKSTD